jgi:hypothetical protein
LTVAEKSVQTLILLILAIPPFPAAILWAVPARIPLLIETQAQTLQIILLVLPPLLPDLQVISHVKVISQPPEAGSAIATRANLPRLDLARANRPGAD